MADHVPEFNERKQEPLREEVKRWRAFNAGKQLRECNRPRIRAVDPTGEKDASSSDKEEPCGNCPQATSVGFASASSSAMPAGETQVHLPQQDVSTLNTFVHVPDSDHTPRAERPASAPARLGVSL